MLRFKVIFLFLSSILFAVNSDSYKQNFKIISSNSNTSKILFTLDNSDITIIHI